MLVPNGKAARINWLSRANGYAFSFSAPCAGKLVLRWRLVPTGKRRPTLVGSARMAFKRARKAKLKVKLTTLGRKRLRHPRHLRLTDTAAFTTAGRKTVTLQQKFTPKR